MSITVTVNLRLDQAEREIRARAQALAAKAALDIEAHAKARAPVDTGLLRNSITAVEVTPDSWLITSPVRYSQFVEFGTSRMAAQPYMLPAVEAVRPILEAGLRRLAA